MSMRTDELRFCFLQGEFRTTNALAAIHPTDSSPFFTARPRHRRLVESDERRVTPIINGDTFLKCTKDFRPHSVAFRIVVCRSRRPTISYNGHHEV